VTPAVDEHQRAIHAEVAQVEQIEAHLAETRVGARGHVSRDRANQGRRLREEVGEVGLAGFRQRLGGERRHRIREALRVLPDT
jgi:hypothetical protein